MYEQNEGKYSVSFVKLYFPAYLHFYFIDFKGHLEMLKVGKSSISKLPWSQIFQKTNEIIQPLLGRKELRKDFIRFLEEIRIREFVIEIF